MTDARACLRSLTLLVLAVTTGCAALPGLPGFSDQPRGPYKSGQVMVDWADPSQSAAVYQRLGLNVLSGAGLETQLVSVPEGQELAMSRTLCGESGVTTAEPNYLKQSSALMTRRLLMTDPALNFPTLAAGVSPAWGIQAIHADQAWNVTAGDPAVIIAVIDTGVDMGHPDLSANLDATDALNLVEQGQPVADDFGHGTHVAGIAAGSGANGTGPLGVAWSCKLMPIRVLGVDGTGTTFDTVDAIQHAVSRGAKVINMSLGSADPSDIEQKAIRQAIDAGVVVVAAAGNEATVGNYLEYPASYPGVVSVGAVGTDLQRAVFSNYDSNVTIAAPGVDIFSSIPRQFAASANNGPYAYFDGTSMAAPFVSGVAALIRSRHPSWTVSQIISQLTRTAHPIAPATGGTPSFNIYTGNGLVDAYQAVSS